MKRRTQTLLYHLLPVVFWLLAIGGSVVPFFIQITPDESPLTYAFGFIPAGLVLASIALLRHIPRHASSLEESFIVALLLGIASYWMPTVLFVTIPLVIYLYIRRLFEPRGWFAFFIGYATIAIWETVLIYLFPETFHLAPFTSNLYYWLPVGALSFAYIASTIGRQNLRVR